MTLSSSGNHRPTILRPSHTMSDSGSPPLETTHNVIFSASLTIYTKPPKGKKGKETKKTKTKDFKFCVSDDNYLEFLQECLETQGMEQYQVTAKWRSSFKYVYPQKVLSAVCQSTSTFNFLTLPTLMHPPTSMPVLQAATTAQKGIYFARRLWEWMKAFMVQLWCLCGGIVFVSTIPQGIILIGISLICGMIPWPRLPRMSLKCNTSSQKSSSLSIRKSFSGTSCWEEWHRNGGGDRGQKLWISGH